MLAANDNFEFGPADAVADRGVPFGTEGLVYGPVSDLKRRVGIPGLADESVS